MAYQELVVTFGAANHREVNALVQADEDLLQAVVCLLPQVSLAGSAGLHLGHGDHRRRLAEAEGQHVGALYGLIRGLLVAELEDRHTPATHPPVQGSGDDLSEVTVPHRNPGGELVDAEIVSDLRGPQVVEHKRKLAGIEVITCYIVAELVHQLLVAELAGLDEGFVVQLALRLLHRLLLQPLAEHAYPPNSRSSPVLIVTYAARS
ncbi:hypothetical protein NEH16_33190 [Streptomyces drozdowiczii]|uniref:Uncharacterized protein n=1 Tax=Streptomyces drozdowiczii TaxID=202862 RepID=A0ABY6Q227_9ACTN|nr:hypothetical protein [Streptomyces drozdowiczii]UZK58292.1 hypothetical protein NEH16_33190 [Streptomyces drozdowiczii]